MIKKKYPAWNADRILKSSFNFISKLKTARGTINTYHPTPVD